MTTITVGDGHLLAVLLMIATARFWAKLGEELYVWARRKAATRLLYRRVMRDYHQGMDTKHALVNRIASRWEFVPGKGLRLRCGGCGDLIADKDSTVAAVKRHRCAPRN